MEIPRRLVRKHEFRLCRDLMLNQMPARRRGAPDGNSQGPQLAQQVETLGRKTRSDGEGQGGG